MPFPSSLSKLMPSKAYLVFRKVTRRYETKRPLSAGLSGTWEFRLACDLLFLELEEAGTTAYSDMMRKENVDAFASQRPFQPFEIRLVDGQRFPVRSVEQFIVGKYHVAVMNPKGIIVTLGLGLISTIRPLVSRRSGSPRRRRRA